MKNNTCGFRLFVALLLSLTVLASCTEVDLCYREEHEHLAKLKFEYKWNNLGSVARPDSMYVIAYRVVNRWKASMVTDSETSRGHFVYNAPVTIVMPPADDTTDDKPGDDTDTDNPENPDNPETPDTPDTPEEGGEGDNPDTPDTPEEGGEGGGVVIESPRRAPTVQAGDDGCIGEFAVPPGSFKFFAFNMDNSQLVYDDVVDYMLDESFESDMNDVYMEYNVYKKGDEHLNMPVIDWQDFNPYAQYMQPDLVPVCYDSIAWKEVPRDSRVTCSFSPKPITQKIDIYFNIKKQFTDGKKFRVDSVLCDISGIPRRISIAGGYLLTERTAKMMFTTTPDGHKTWKGFDSDNSANAIRVHGLINVPGLVQNSTSSVNTGPGVMQVFIYTSAEVDGKRVSKKIQGRINLYNTLRKAKLLRMTDDGRHAVRTTDHGILDIVADIVVDGEKVQEFNDENGGIDLWEDCTVAPPQIDI